MLNSQINLQDFYIQFDEEIEQANQSIQQFYNLLKSDQCEIGKEQFENCNKFKIFINEITNKGKSKQNISSIIEKYSKSKQLEQSTLFLSNCQRKPYISIIILNKDEFEDFENIFDMAEKQMGEDCKTILILEEVKELIFAQQKYLQQQQEFDQFILNLQLNYRLDVIHSKSIQQTIDEIIQILICGQKLNKKKKKISCIFRDRTETNFIKADNLGIKNYYELMWMSMLTQIHGISEAKARAIVLKYPTIQSLMNAYQNTTLDQRPYLLSDIDVIQGIVQQSKKKLGQTLSELIYTIFTSTNSDQKIFD